MAKSQLRTITPSPKPVLNGSKLEELSQPFSPTPKPTLSPIGLTPVREAQKQVLLLYLSPKGKRTPLDVNTYATLAAKGLIIPVVEELINVLVSEGKVLLTYTPPGVVVELMIGEGN